MALYINGTYTPNNYVVTIRSCCGEKEAESFLINKHRWSKSTISDIEWDLQANFFKNQTYSRKEILIKFVHRWFASGNKNYGQKLMCPHCRQQESTSMDHDHFLTCSSYCRFSNLLQHLNTPPAIIKLLVHGLQSFYNSQLNNIHAPNTKQLTTKER